MVLMLALCGARSLRAQEDKNGQQQPSQQQLAEEYENKAKQVICFAKYTKWPDHFAKIDSKEFIIGIVGEDPFGKFLEKYSGSELRANGPRIVIKQFKTADDFTPCHLLFISKNSVKGAPRQTPEERLKAILEKSKGSKPLIVSDTKGLNKKGSMINFFLVQEDGQMRVKFEIDKQGVKDASLEVDSRVLELAREPKDKE